MYSDMSESWGCIRYAGFFWHCINNLHKQCQNVYYGGSISCSNSEFIRTAITLNCAEWTWLEYSPDFFKHILCGFGTSFLHTGHALRFECPLNTSYQCWLSSLTDLPFQCRPETAFFNLDILTAILDPCVQSTEVFAHTELGGLASLLSSSKLIVPWGSTHLAPLIRVWFSYAGSEC